MLGIVIPFIFTVRGRTDPDRDTYDVIITSLGLM